MPRHQSLDKLGIGAGSAYHLNFCIVEPSPPSAEGSQIQLSKQKKPPNPIWGWRIFGSDSRIRTCDQPVTNVTSGFPKGSDYIITVVFNDFRCRALSEGLFLSSPSSLCTFRAPFMVRHAHHKYRAAWLRVGILKLSLNSPGFHFTVSRGGC